MVTYAIFSTENPEQILKNNLGMSKNIKSLLDVIIYEECTVVSQHKVIDHLQQKLWGVCFRPH